MEKNSMTQVIDDSYTIGKKRRAENEIEPTWLDSQSQKASRKHFQGIHNRVGTFIAQLERAAE